MKKLLILGILSSLSAFSMGPVFRVGADYTMYSTKRVKIEAGLVGTEIKPTNASAYSGVFELGYLLDMYSKNFGISIEPGLIVSSGYGKYDKVLNKEQKFIPTYLGAYIRPSFGYKFNNNLKLTFGGYVSAGSLITYFMEDNETGSEKGTRIGIAIPFGGTIGLEYNNFSIQINGGVKYLFAEIPEKLKEVIDNYESSQDIPKKIKEIKEEVLKENPLSYNVNVSKNGIKKQNKFTPSFGITIGYKIGR